MTWPLEADMVSFYGDPDPDRDGRPNAGWESANLVFVTAPWAMRIALDAGVHPVTRLRVHRLVAPSLARVFAAIKEVFPSQALINGAGLDWFGGAYVFRNKRGLTTRSTHAYGCAIDLAPARNPLGQRWRPDGRMMDSRVVSAFKAEGWVWGGDFKSRPDCMHFQAARAG
jgi:D-alanyl-D-alanine carboxypeptidase